MTTYLIYKDGITISVKNENTGNVEFTGTDISAVLTFVNNAIIDSGIVTIKEGLFTPSSAVVFTKSIKLIGNGNVIFNWNNKGQELFTFSGSELITTMITSDVVAGANSVPVTSVGTAAVGDLLLIYDNAIWTVNYPTCKTGELHEISSISGNVITIEDSTINTFTMARNGSVILIRPITVTIDGIAINGVDQAADYSGIRLYYNKNSIIRNGKFQNNGDREIGIRNSYNTNVDNNIIGNSIMDGYGYGISVSDASAYTTISNNHFYNCRHCVTLGGYGVVGQSRDTTVIGNTFADSTGTDNVLDAHTMAESYYICNNIIYSPFDHYAIGSGAKITKVTGNMIIGGLGLVPGLATPSPGYTYIIEDNIFKNTRYIFRYWDTTDIVNQVSIKNNIINGDIYGIAILYNATSFIISGNQFDSAVINTGNWGIYINNSKNGLICNNVIHNAYKSGISLAAKSNNNIISGNMLTNYNTGNDKGESGIKITTSSYNTVSCNTLVRSPGINTYGIVESGSSDYSRIFDNDLSQVGDNSTVAQRVKTAGTNTAKLLRNNLGYTTENDVLSGTFAIDSTGIKTVTISHGLAIIPNIQDCYVTIVKNTNVADWTCSLLIIDSTDTTNVVVKVGVSGASVTSGATAKLAVRVGNP